MPRPIRLASPAPRAVLAVGGELKSTVAVVSGLDLVASPHIGDLENEPTFESFRRAARRMLDYYGVEPEVIAADLHPGLRVNAVCDRAFSPRVVRSAPSRAAPLRALALRARHLGRIGADLGNGADLGRIGADLGNGADLGRIGADLGNGADLGRIGADLGNGADLGRIGDDWSGAPGDGPFLGIILDGTGYGSDGTLWGGELLLGNSRGFERVAHLRNMSLPGGEAAIREPWRILAGLGLEPPVDARPDSELAAVATIAANPRLSPVSSSCGRLFDAAAAILGFDRRVTFEGEAAIWLESLAAEATTTATAPIFRFAPMDGPELLRALREAAPDPGVMKKAALSRLALGFHLSLAENIADEATRIAVGKGLDEAFLSGGVFQNRIFTSALVETLARRGIAARLGIRVPPNDGCISIGQAAYAIGAANAIMQ